MKSEVDESLILKRRQFYNWMLSAFAATSFAMMLFYADKQTELSPEERYAFCCFLVAAVFACAALVISGTAQVRGVELTDTVDFRHSLSFLFSLLCFVIGLAIFLYSISHIFMATFALTGIVAVSMCARVEKEQSPSL